MVPPATLGDERQRIRGRIRDMRRSMDERRRIDAENRIVGRLRRLPEFHAAARIGVYLAFDGEPSTAPVVRLARRCGKRLFAPAILPRGGLAFLPLDADSRLAGNRFGILEPSRGLRVDPRGLDLILTPLVAFDDRGTRLGVGGGFYDRCFSYLRHRSLWLRPKLLGIGYEFQHLSRLQRRPWDVRLWAAVTDRNVYRFDGEHQ